MLRKSVLVGSPILFGAAAVVKAPVPGESVDELSHYKCKPSELPLYAPLHTLNKLKPICHPPKDSATRSAIEGGIRAVRVEVFNAYDAVSSQKKNLDEFIETGKAHSQFAVDYLNEPANAIPRAGAIAIGGLSGMIFAIRGGFIRKLFYTSIGAGAIASLCYPKEAEEYAQLSLIEAKKGFSIAYNFAFGIKPEDNVKPDALSKFPTNLSQLTDLVTDFASSAKEAVLSSKK